MNFIFTKKEINILNNDYSFDLAQTKNLVIEGSPERVNRRDVLNSKDEYYLVESFNKNHFENKLKIAKVLDFLKNKSELVNPIIKNNNLDYFTLINDNEYVQISKYYHSYKIIRPDYLDSEIIAFEIMKVLKTLNHDFDFLKIDKITILEKLKHDIYSIIKIISKNYSEINIIKKFLENNFFSIIDKFQIKFNHADLHPLNFIWNEKQKIIKIIDWEFCGYNIENYDLANLLGCIISENPYKIKNGLLFKIIQLTKKNNLISDFAFQNLIYTIIANRIFWINEWNRKKDFEMIKQEIDLMNFLIINEKKIKEFWSKI